MENKIFVTGATGNVGKHLVEQLKSRGADLVAGTSGHVISGVDTANIDFADVVSLEKAMQGSTTLFMLMPAHPDTAQWGRNIIRAAKNAGIKHIVRSSVAAAYQAPSYGFMKLIRETDQDVINSGLGYTITTPQFFMQNFSTSLAGDYKSGALYLPAGEGKAGWVDVRDIAAVNTEILLKPDRFNQQTLLITGSESFSYGEAVMQMNEILGRESQYIPVPDDVAINGMKEKHFPPFFIDVMMDLGAAVAGGYADELSDTVKKVTGREPVTFRQFVRDHKDAWI